MMYKFSQVEVATRCRICEDIEEYIKSLAAGLDELKRDRDSLPLGSWDSLRGFLESEIEDTETKIRVAREVIDEVIGKVIGDKV